MKGLIFNDAPPIGKQAVNLFSNGFKFGEMTLQPGYTGNKFKTKIEAWEYHRRLVAWQMDIWFLGYEKGTLLGELKATIQYEGVS